MSVKKLLALSKEGIFCFVVNKKYGGFIMKWIEEFKRDLISDGKSKNRVKILS